MQIIPSRDTKLPDSVSVVIVNVLAQRPQIDTILFYARWYVGMSLPLLAERVGHTTEYVRLRLNKINADIRKQYEQEHPRGYRVSLVEEREEDDAYSETDSPSSDAEAV